MSAQPNTSLAVIDRQQQIAASRYDNAELVATIKATVAKGATDAQLRMFLEVCKATGLDPFLKEIWYVAEKGIIMAGRDGYLRVANENPNFDGMETRVERDEKNLPIKAICTVWRKDRTHPVVCEAYYNEYNKQSPVWRQYPSAMIQKVAEVLALKRSFAINGVVTEEEVGHDGAGSAAAAQEVATQKIAALQTGQRLPVLDAEPVETTLHEDIVAAEEARTPRKHEKAYNKFAMYEAMEVLKNRYIALMAESEYRAILLRYNGAHKRTELRDDDGGIQARACYKELSLRIADLEAADQQAYAAMPDFAEWPDDPLGSVLGTRIVINGVRYRRETADADAWREVGAKAKRGKK